MRDGQCPKCGEHEIHLQIGRNDYRNQLSISGLRYALLDNYVCAACGYVESYVARRDHLNSIAEKWPKVRDATDQETRRLPSLPSD